MTTTFDSPAVAGARPTSWEEARALAVLPIYSADKPNLAGLTGWSRDAAYRATRERSVHSVRVGGRVFVPVTPLRRLLGDLPTESDPTTTP